MLKPQNKKNARNAKTNGPMNSRKMYESSSGRRKERSRLRGAGRAPEMEAIRVNRSLVAAVSGQNAVDVGLRFRIRRNAVIFVDGAGPRVVGRNRELDVIAVAFEQAVQVARSAVDVLRRIERVADSAAGRRAGHQLHETLRARTADGRRIARRFRHHYGIDQT